MLDRIERFTNEALLRRLSDETETDAAGVPRLVARHLDAAFTEHQRWLAQWQHQVAGLGDSIGAAFDRHFQDVESRLRDTSGEQWEAASRVLGTVSESCNTLNEMVAALCRSLDSSPSRLQEVATSIDRVHDEFHVLAERSCSLLQAVGERLEGNSESLARLLNGLETSVVGTLVGTSELVDALRRMQDEQSATDGRLIAELANRLEDHHRAAAAGLAQVDEQLALHNRRVERLAECVCRSAETHQVLLEQLRSVYRGNGSH